MSEEGRFRGWDHWQFVFVIAAFCLAAVWFSGQVLWPSATTLTQGFGAYYSASRLLSNGEISADIYDPAYFRPIVQRDSQGEADDIYNANPPTTTLMLWPLSFLSIQQARLAWTAANIVFLLGGLGLLLWGFGVTLRERKQWLISLAALTFGLLFRPVVQNFMFGQAYGLVFFLLSITTAVFFKTGSLGTDGVDTISRAYSSDRPERAGTRPLPYQTKPQEIRKTLKSRSPNHPINDSTAGIALALALLLKTAGWPLLILLFWLRRIRFLAWTVGVGVVVFLVCLPVFPLEMWLAYGRLLGQVGRSPLICVPAYQTTRSWLCHLFAPGVFWQEAETAGIGIPTPVTIVYFVLGIVCLIVLLGLARKRPDSAFIGFVCWSVLFLPLGEIHHHTVMLIPFVWLMVRWAEQSRFSRLVFIIAAVCYLISFPVNAPQFQSGWLALLAYPYLAGAWLIFGGILWDHKSEMLPGRGQPR